MTNRNDVQDGGKPFCRQKIFTLVRVGMAASILLVAASCVNDMRGRDVTRPPLDNPIGQSVAPGGAPTEPTGLQEVPSNTTVRYIQALPGDTVRIIAARIDVDADQLALINNLLPDSLLRTGQLVAVPINKDAAKMGDIARISARALEEEKPIQTSESEGLKLRDPFADNDELPAPPASNEPLPANIETVDLPESPDLSQYQTTQTLSRLQMPVQGDIIREYSEGPNGNDGIDIRARAGSPVVAAADGEVVLLSQASRDSDNKAILLIRHPDDLFTVYSGLTETLIEKGNRVERGQILGVIASGEEEFLHFEVRIGTKSTDPIPYLF